MKRIFLLAVMLTMSLSACTLGDLQVQPLSAPTEAALPAATSTTEPSPEAAQTATPIPTATPDYGDIFKDARLLNTRALNDLDFLVVIETKKDLPNGAATAITVDVNAKSYRCTMLEQFVRRLYCVGTPPKIGTDAPVLVKVTGVTTPVYETSFKAELLPAVTPLETLDATQVAALALQASQTPAITATAGKIVAGTPSSGTALAGTQAAGTPAAGTAVAGSGTPNAADVLQPGGLAGGGMEGVGGGIGPTATPEDVSTPQP